MGQPVIDHDFDLFLFLVINPEWGRSGCGQSFLLGLNGCHVLSPEPFFSLSCGGASHKEFGCDLDLHMLIDGRSYGCPWPPLSVSWRLAEAGWACRRVLQ